MIGDGRRRRNRPWVVLSVDDFLDGIVIVFFFRVLS
jgi:hypothetical protein